MTCKPLLIAPLILTLAGCEAYDAGHVAGDGARDLPPVAGLTGQPGYAMARQACGRALVQPGGLMRVEFERDALEGALIMMHVRNDPSSDASQRWRCYFNYQTRAMRVVPA